MADLRNEQAREDAAEARAGYIETQVQAMLKSSSRFDASYEVLTEDNNSFHYLFETIKTEPENDHVVEIVTALDGECGFRGNPIGNADWQQDALVDLLRYEGCEWTQADCERHSRSIDVVKHIDALMFSKDGSSEFRELVEEKLTEWVDA